jgi:hypothetical protein
MLENVMESADNYFGRKGTGGFGPAAGLTFEPSGGIVHTFAIGG